MKRDSVISIAKGIAIILMVIGHAEAPELLTNFIYTFHMPLFFIAAGYFFNRKYLSDPWTFISKRIKGLYFPFVKWSMIFLLLHNLWFHFGILNEQYGNWTGGVTHPYTIHNALQRAVLIITGMSGYDEFMAGAFWFFRGLFVASILFLLIYKAIDSTGKFSPTGGILAVCMLSLGFTAFHILSGVKINVLAGGGWRETWGIFFFGIGALLSHYLPAIRRHWALFLLYLAILLVSAKLHFSGMNNSGKLADLITLPLTGTIGFLAVHYLASIIDAKDGRLRKLLVFIGDNTLYVFIFHIISFKLVSLIKIWWYGLDPAQIGCHMVIHFNNHDDVFWILYSIVGVAVPLIVVSAIRNLSKSGFIRMPYIKKEPTVRGDRG